MKVSNTEIQQVLEDERLSEFPIILVLKVLTTVVEILEEKCVI